MKTGSRDRRLEPKTVDAHRGEKSVREQSSAMKVREEVRSRVSIETTPSASDQFAQSMMRLEEKEQKRTQSATKMIQITESSKIQDVEGDVEGFFT